MEEGAHMMRDEEQRCQWAHFYVLAAGREYSLYIPRPVHDMHRKVMQRVWESVPIAADVPAPQLAAIMRPRQLYGSHSIPLSFNGSTATGDFEFPSECSVARGNAMFV
jgi:hypothetical protein